VLSTAGPAGTFTSVAHARSEPGVELVTNGGFENGTAGWHTNRKRQLLSATRPSVSGEASARLKMTKPGRTVLRSAQPAVTSADPTQTYTVSAFVRSTDRPTQGRLRVREMTGGGRWADQHAIDFTATGSWKKIVLSFTPTSSGALDVSVVGLRLPLRMALLVDDITMTSTLSPGDDVTPPEGCVADPMGIPAPGTTFLGAAVNGTSDLGTRETQLGSHLSLHRTYFQANNIAGAVKQANADHAAGRLPWISFKEPLSWADMAAGKGNTWATQVADALATVDGPIWLAVHHEPENDGDMALWTQMQAQIAPIIHARTDNVAYSVIYSGWNTFGGGNNTVATKWPGDANIDILAIDAYNDYGTDRDGDGVLNKKILDLSTYFAKMKTWSDAHGTAWALGETGQTNLAATVDPTWIQRSYQQMIAAGGAGFAYYDSSANSVGNWTLDDTTKRASFKSQMPLSPRICS
jgi:hypothetical protein